MTVMIPGSKIHTHVKATKHVTDMYIPRTHTHTQVQRQQRNLMFFVWQGQGAQARIPPHTHTVRQADPALGEGERNSSALIEICLLCRKRGWEPRMLLASSHLPHSLFQGPSLSS